MAKAAEPRSADGLPLGLRLAPAVFLLLWSAGFAVVKMGLRHADPITFLALRYALVVAALLPLFLALRPPLPKGAVEWGHLAAVGFLIQVLYFGLSYAAMAGGVSAGALALIVSLQPILVGLLAPRFARERVGVWRWAGLGLGLAGAAMVIAERSAVEASSALGALAAVGALAGMTAGTLYEKRFGVLQHPLTAALAQHTVGLAATLPWAWAFEDMRVAWTGELLVSLGYLVVANSLVSLTLLLAMIRRREVSRVSALFFLVPPTAALIAWAFVGEVLSPLAWAGMAIAAGGVAIAGRRRAPVTP
jgi:drug/metabolite transporter (DMT)-like permease